MFPSTQAVAHKFSYSEKRQNSVLSFSNFKTEIKPKVYENDVTMKQFPTNMCANGVNTNPFSTVVHVRENVVAPQEMVTACSPPDDGREW